MSAMFYDHEPYEDDYQDRVAQWLECPMCGTSNSFRIHPQDASRGYCRKEARTWVLRPNNNGLPDGYYWWRRDDRFAPEIVEIQTPWVLGMNNQRSFKLENCDGEFIAVEPPPWTIPTKEEGDSAGTTIELTPETAPLLPDSQRLQNLCVMVAELAQHVAEIDSDLAGLHREVEHHEKRLDRVPDSQDTWMD